MFELETAVVFLGWCAVINAGILLYSTLMLVFFNRWVKRAHASLFSVNEAALDAVYFQFLSNYKLVTIFFNLVPYCALKLI